MNHNAREQAARLSAAEERWQSGQKLAVSPSKFDTLTVKNLKVENDVTIGGQYKIDGVQISSTDLSDGTNIAHLSATQSFSGANVFSSPGNRFVGDGSGLTGIAGSGTANTTVYNTVNTLATLDGQNGAFYQNSSNQNAGTLPDARLSPNVTLQGNAFNGASQLVQLTAGGILPVLDGSNLTGITATTLNGQNGAFYRDASNMNAGILPDARLSPNVTLQGNTFNGANQLVQLTAGGLLPVLNGSNLSNVNAAQLGGQSASYYTNASNISLGTLADGRLSGNVALYNAATPNFTGTLQHNGSNVCDATNNCNYAPASGGGNYIQNGTSPQTADFNITGDGTIGDTLFFGAAQDTNLYRQAADQLKTDDAFIVGAYEIVQNGLYIDRTDGGASGGLHLGSAEDTNLYRGAAHTLRTDGGLQILNASSDLPLLVQSANAGVDQAWFQVSGDTNPRTAIQGNMISFGPGNAALDTNLYRAGANHLKTDDDFSVGGSLGVTNTATFSSAVDIQGNLQHSTNSDFSIYASTSGKGIDLQSNGGLVRIGRYSDDVTLFSVSDSTGQLAVTTQGSGGGLLIGGDANLYRSAAATLKTDGTFNAVTALQLNGVNINTAGTLTNVAYLNQVNTFTVSQIVQGSVTAERSGDLTALNARQIGDAVSRFTARTTGVLQWSDGTLTADTNLYRSAADTLKTDDALTVTGTLTASGVIENSLYVNNGGQALNSTILAARATGNANNRLTVSNSGVFQWGDGTAALDTTLSRASAGVLATNGGLNVNGQIAITSNGSALNFTAGPGQYYAAASNPQHIFYGGATEYGRFNSSGNFNLAPTIQLGWGASLGTIDTNLYRDSAAVLRTDGTLKVVSSALPSLDLYMNSSTNALQVRRVGDSGIRLAITDTGQLNWGDGTAAADTNLFRAAADILRTNDYFQVVRATPGQGVLAIGDSNSTNDFNWRMISTGQMFWGPGTSAVDTNLSRSGVNSLQASGNFAALSAIVAGSGASTQVQLTSVAGQAGLYFGSSSDTNLYRNNAAGVLKTDGQFITGGVIGAKVASPDNSFAIDAGGSIRLQGGTNYIAFNNGSAEVAGIQVGSGATPNITINGNLIVATNGNITANNALIQAGATIAGAATSINASSNFSTDINTGTSTGAVSIGNTGAASTVSIQGGTSGSAISISTGSGGTLSMGNGGVAGTIQIGNTTGAVNQTISIGNNATLSSSTTINLGSAIGTSAINMLAGTAGLTFQPTGNSSNVGMLILPGNDTTKAFQVQNAAGTTTLLNTDTTNLVVTVAGNTTNFATLTLTNAHFKSTQTNPPTIGTPAACGGSPTAAVQTGSTDSAGSFRITSGTGSPTTCDTIITFNKGYGAAPKSIMLLAETKDGGTGTAVTRQIFVTGASTTTFTVKYGAGVLASEVNWFYYWVIE